MSCRRSVDVVGTYRAYRSRAMRTLRVGRELWVGWLHGGGCEIAGVELDLGEAAVRVGRRRAAPEERKDSDDRHQCGPDDPHVHSLPAVGARRVGIVSSDYGR